MTVGTGTFNLMDYLLMLLLLFLFVFFLDAWP